jgi:hypothetical protein
MLTDSLGLALRDLEPLVKQAKEFVFEARSTLGSSLYDTVEQWEAAAEQAIACQTLALDRLKAAVSDIEQALAELKEAESRNKSASPRCTRKQARAINAIQREKSAPSLSQEEAEWLRRQIDEPGEDGAK